MAFAELAGVGDRTLGQWEERFTAYHLRRRLTLEEARIIGPVVDIRGTPEAWARFKTLPPAVRRITGNQPL